jgi:hypothetical protein
MITKYIVTAIDKSNDFTFHQVCIDLDVVVCLVAELEEEGNWIIVIDMRNKHNGQLIKEDYSL